MRKLLILLLAAGSIGGFEPLVAQAAPVGGAAIGDLLKAASPIEEARVFCYNRYSGRFLHWGSCHRRHYVRRHYRPRVYCYNRRTGRFLHWGHC